MVLAARQFDCYSTDNQPFLGRKVVMPLIVNSRFSSTLALAAFGTVWMEAVRRYVFVCASL